MIMRLSSIGHLPRRILLISGLIAMLITSLVSLWKILMTSDMVNILLSQLAFFSITHPLKFSLNVTNDHLVFVSLLFE